MRERERETEYKNQAKKITPTIFPFVDSCPISLGFSRESPARCFVAYVYNGRERERRREYLAGSYYYNEMRIALHTCLPDNFLVC